ncbi:conserved hypothetical protein [Anaeromyxobacter sp. K]|uniref:Z1 domain-containing protein n=1 Tax=Anaeromyxobacter sp. (strain K) TaxID=447217 RepID=UPI00017BE384|nr:Z1 domain-containing protein [Anaeromyxobacter sp. K]ACG75139.1 conserved hypothetical protein [Anaeromyxobacter sp. K]
MTTTATIKPVASSVPLRIDGVCIRTFLELVEEKYGAPARADVLACAKRTVSRCVSAYALKFGEGDVGDRGTGTVAKPFRSTAEERIPNGTTGLLYGKVQAGKTNAALAAVALARDNGFRCFVVLTSDNTLLGDQTFKRFRDNLIARAPYIASWETFKSDPRGYGKNQLAGPNRFEDTGVVLVSTKNVSNLQSLLDVLKSADARRYPAIIIDDEADNASLNTNASRTKKKEDDPSEVFRVIGEIRKTIPNHVYLQVTATPQSLLLQGLNHPSRPVFCELVPEGEGYVGGNVFFADVDSPTSLCVKLDDKELDQFKPGRIVPGGASEPPDGLRNALCCFFLGAAQKQLRGGKHVGLPYTILIHVSRNRADHEYLAQVVQAFVTDLDKAVRGAAPKTKQEKADRWLQEAYAELARTAKLRPLPELKKHLADTLTNAIPAVVNADSKLRGLEYRPGVNIMIGGNRLGRGLTIDGLMITYYGRDPKTKMSDTVHQHARMFGYRTDLLDVTRLFSAPHLIDAFQRIHEADEGMRNAIGNDPANLKVKPVWVGAGLKPTRSNVLNPADIEGVEPGRVIYPPDPLWRKADISAHTSELDRLLSKYDDDDAYVEVGLDEIIAVLKHMPSKPFGGYTWEDERVQELLKAMKAPEIGLTSARLNVRRNQGRGYDLRRQDPPWSGFASSGWYKHAKANYEQVPTLIVMMQKGERAKRWDDCRVYVPTLVIPKSKFVFMFNYAAD